MIETSEDIHTFRNPYGCALLHAFVHMHIHVIPYTYIHTYKDKHNTYDSLKVGWMLFVLLLYYSILCSNPSESIIAH